MCSLKLSSATKHKSTACAGGGLRQHPLRGLRDALQCPAMCLSERERRFKAFANRNALVDDPAAAFLAEDQVCFSRLFQVVLLIDIYFKLRILLTEFYCSSVGRKLYFDRHQKLTPELQVRPWTEEEKRTFLDKFILHPKARPRGNTAWPPRCM